MAHGIACQQYCIDRQGFEIEFIRIKCKSFGCCLANTIQATRSKTPLGLWLQTGTERPWNHSTLVALFHVLECWEPHKNLFNQLPYSQLTLISRTELAVLVTKSSRLSAIKSMWTIGMSVIYAFQFLLGSKTKIKITVKMNYRIKQ